MSRKQHPILLELIDNSCANPSISLDLEQLEILKELILRELASPKPHTQTEQAILKNLLRRFTSTIRLAGRGYCIEL